MGCFIVRTVSLYTHTSCRSRAGKIDKDLEILKAYCSVVKEMSFKVYVFRDSVEKGVSFKVTAGRCDDMIAFLRKVFSIVLFF